MYQVENENLPDWVNKVAQKRRVPSLSEVEVTAKHRVSSKPNETPGIIEISRRATSGHWLVYKFSLKTEITTYVQENMTSRNRFLLFGRKSWAR